MIPPIINRKVAFLMIALCIYGILLIVITTKSISPYSYIMSNFYDGASPTRSTVNDTKNSPGNLNGNMLGNGQFGQNLSGMSRISIDVPPTRLHNLTNDDFFNFSNRTNNHTINGSNTGSITSNSGSNSGSNIGSNEVLGSLDSSSSSSTVTSSSSTTEQPTTTATPTREKPILTIFTTFKNSATKDHIYKNTIHNWALLRPYVNPVMYVIPGEIDLAEYGKPLGWDSYNVPKSSKQVVPILRHMFLDAQKKYDSTFYAYANGDILFTEDLIDSLKAIVPYKDKIKTMLLVGRRTNCQLKPGQEIRSLDEVGRIIKTGKLFNSNAQDYFISTHNGYPWGTIPDFVVGRVGYDNWLVVTALTKGMAVLDLSGTVRAMHQTGTDGNMAGHSKKPKGDTYINYGLAGKRFDYSMGHVTCGQFYTAREGSTIKVLERKKNGCEKLFKKYRRNPYLKLPSL